MNTEDRNFDPSALNEYQVRRGPGANSFEVWGRDHRGSHHLATFAPHSGDEPEFQLVERMAHLYSDQQCCWRSSFYEYVTPEQFELMYRLADAAAGACDDPEVQSPAGCQRLFEYGRIGNGRGAQRRWGWLGCSEGAICDTDLNRLLVRATSIFLGFTG